MEEPQRAHPRTVTTTTSSFAENFSTSSSSFAYDREFLRTVPGLLIVAEIVLGLLVWTLIAGTEYFRVPAFGWVMFVAVFYWVLTVFFLIVYITMTYTRIPRSPGQRWVCALMAVPSSYTSRPLLWTHLPSPRRGMATTSTAGLLHRSLPSWSPSATLETHISVS